MPCQKRKKPIEKHEKSNTGYCGDDNGHTDNGEFARITYRERYNRLVLQAPEPQRSGGDRKYGTDNDIRIVRYISGDDLQRKSGTNIVDAISSEPGVSQITTGGGISKPVIRGLGYNRIVAVSSGVRQEGQQWGDEHGLELDGADVSSVEILKGPASLVYGSDALAGVIKFNSAPIVPYGKMRANTRLITDYLAIRSTLRATKTATCGTLATVASLPTLIATRPTDMCPIRSLVSRPFR